MIEHTDNYPMNLTDSAYFPGQILTPNAFMAYIILRHYLTLPIIGASILCIIVTIVLVTRRNFWRPAAVYLIVLAGVDLTSLVLLGLLSLDYFLLITHDNDQVSLAWLYDIGVEDILGECVDTLIFISNWLTAVLATERYIAICHPLYCRRIRRVHRTWIVILVFLITVAIKLPGFLITILREPHLAAFDSVLFKVMHTWVVQVGLFLIVPFAILTFVNVRLIQTVRRSTRVLRQLLCGGSQQQQPSTPRSTVIQVHCDAQESTGRQKSSQDSNFRASWLGAGGSSSWLRLLRCCRHTKEKSRDEEEPTSPGNRPMGKTKMTYREDSSFSVKESGKKKNLRTSREELKITVTLVCLIFTFLVFQSPFVLISTISKVISETGTTPTVNKSGRYFTTSFVSSEDTIKIPPIKYLDAISVIALALKSDLYFYFYCWFSDRIKNTMKVFVRTHLAQFRSRPKVSVNAYAVPQNGLPYLNMPMGSTFHDYRCISRPNYCGAQRCNTLYNQYHHHYCPPCRRPNVTYKQPLLPFIMDSKRSYLSNLSKSRSMPGLQAEKSKKSRRISHQCSRRPNCNSESFMRHSCTTGSGAIKKSRRHRLSKSFSWLYRYKSEGNPLSSSTRMKETEWSSANRRTFDRPNSHIPFPHNQRSTCFVNCTQEGDQTWSALALPMRPSSDNLCCQAEVTHCCHSEVVCEEALSSPVTSSATDSRFTSQVETSVSNPGHNTDQLGSAVSDSRVLS